eukprot:jgi/Ulvmu1/10925/UM007_0104.1
MTWKSEAVSSIGVYRMCGLSVCGEPIMKLGSCTKIGCPEGERCNTCFARLEDIGEDLDDLPLFVEGGQVGRYGLQFDGETCPFMVFGSDFRVVRDCSEGRAWWEQQGWLAGCVARVSCRARGGRACRGDDPTLDVAVTGRTGHTDYYGLGNAESLEECIAGGQGGGVPSGEVVGVDCVDKDA